jgi:PAS domain S-box-containing protein
MPGSIGPPGPHLSHLACFSPDLDDPYRFHTPCIPVETPGSGVGGICGWHRAAGTGSLTSLTFNREEIRRSGDLGLAMLEGLRDTTILVFDRDLRFTLVAGAALLDDTVTRAKVEGRTLAEVVPAEKLPLLEPAYRAALEGRETVLNDSLSWKPDVTYRLHIAPLEASGAVVGGIVTVWETSDVGLPHPLSSDRAFRSTFESSPIGIAIVGLDGRWLEVNRAACQITGYAADELTRMKVLDITHPVDVENVRETTELLLAGHVDRAELHMRCLGPDGKARPVIITGSLLQDDNRANSCVIAQIQEDPESPDRDEPSASPRRGTGGPRMLGIGDVAELTGLTEATLRKWETRYGFPVPLRQGGGQRRYTSEHVERLRQVVHDREHGLSLKSAIERAERAERRLQSSLFALLRQRHHVSSVRLAKPMLTALCQAIEDEALTRGERMLVAASFQRREFYEQARARWEVLGQSAELAIVRSDFEAAGTVGGIHEIPVAPSDPMAREWSLIAWSPGCSACLAAWEPPRSSEARAGIRTLEVAWTADAAIVRDAARAATRHAADTVPEVAEAAEDLLALEPDHDVVGACLTSLTNRMLEYVARS